MTDQELLRNALNEKLYMAEKRISMLRLLVVMFNSVVYLIFMESGEFQQLAFAIIGVANIYAIWSLVFEPYKKFVFLAQYYFTTVSDALLIGLWIVATGYMDSPFYVMLYISILAVAFRYSLTVTAFSSAIYLLLYLIIFFFDPHSSLFVEDLLVRVGYIPLAGMLGMYFSIEISDQIAGKIKIVKGEKALQQAHTQLEVKVGQRTEELSRINKDLTDSINYAERIQTAILPTDEEFKARFPESFIIHRPKDIISGDFHWIHDQDNLTYLAVVDCTGHGVPGALMSMIGNNLLNRAFLDKGIIDPGEALTDMDITLGNMLKNDSQGYAVNDGMDMTLCVIDHEKGELHYEGARGHAFVSRSGEMSELIGTKFSIGGLMAGQNKNFITRTVKFNKGDLLYLFSDGYQDQFGGPRGKKFYRKNLVWLMQQNASKPMIDQKNILMKSLVDWQGPLSQIDDVTVVGIRL